MHRARDRVRDDAALVGDVASAASSAAGLDRTNRTLGRNIVIAALDAHIAASGGAASTTSGSGSGSGSVDDEAGGDGLRLGESAFRKAARGYGPLGDAMLSDVYGKVTMRLKGALVQQQAMEEEHEAGGEGEGDGDGGEDGGVVGFRKAERLSGVGVGVALKGGLVKRHTFQVQLTKPAWRRMHANIRAACRT